MQQHLIKIATAARSFLEPVWVEWHKARGGPVPPIHSQYTCGRSSLFIVRALRHEGIAGTWRSGVPRHSENGPDLGPLGFHGKDRWEGHAWVEAGGYILDITADQFGASPVIVVPVGDERYSPGDLDTALPVHIANRIKAVDAIWPLWLACHDQAMGR
ncbi:hypothetical protein FOH24_12435 [Acetobacter tropicalis]|nr:lasso peptide biosynthesis protein [Acetobacter tropicalis]KAA8388650.1 hypothetical protein FOH24_12435 [Acetobacter tropicalis]KAA8391208.1 hypothetical protein FOH22_00880 [Acetobacter tropicalis]MBC9009261.1 lasso peptide biosynthesis protein [Acetobacter tropicalis]MDO8170697.1 lasso peptide biosynthesis protein [Acetobacter tropicalis]